MIDIIQQGLLASHFVTRWECNLPAVLGPALNNGGPSDDNEHFIDTERDIGEVWGQALNKGGSQCSFIDTDRDVGEMWGQALNNGGPSAASLIRIGM